MNVSVNAMAAPLVQRLVDESGALRLGVRRLAGGCTIVDAGIDVEGGLEAGRRIAEICLGGLGAVRLATDGAASHWPLTIHVHTANPVIACLGCQYAGWSLKHGNEFHALGSGPGRSLALKEPLFETLRYQDEGDQTCLVLEADKPPPAPLIDKIVRDCGVAAERLTLVLTPTTSLAGNVQIVARVLEVALHKAHELGFALEHIVDGAGSAPMPPPAKDFLTAMGRSNDAIVFGGQVQLYVRGDDAAAKELAARLPSSTSNDYGRPFAEVFKSYDYDFFKVDPMLFSPASVVVTALDSGASFRAGAVDMALLNKSFDT